MSKKTIGFDLIFINLVKCPLAHQFYISYYLLSFELYAHSTLQHVSKQSYFKGRAVYRCEVQEMGGLEFIFWKSSAAILITISAWCQNLWIFWCNGLKKWL